MFKAPKALEAELESKAKDISSYDFIQSPRNKILKEMWCAARFGIGYERHVSECHVKVNDEEYSDTDFILKTEAGMFSFQTTMSDMPGRRMGDDHKPGPDGSVPTRPYEPERGRIEGPSWIASSVQEKVEKRYSDAVNICLLIYANFPAHQMDYEDVCTAVEEYKGNFLAMWVITNHQICSLESPKELGEIKRFANIYEPDDLLSTL